MNHPKVKAAQTFFGRAPHFKHAYKETSSTESEDKMTDAQDTGNSQKRPSGRQNRQNLESRTESGRQKSPSEQIVRPTRKHTRPTMPESNNSPGTEERPSDRYRSTNRQASRQGAKTENFDTSSNLGYVKRRKPSDRHKKSSGRQIPQKIDTKTENFDTDRHLIVEKKRKPSDRLKKDSGRQTTKQIKVRIPPKMKGKKQGTDYTLGELIDQGNQGIVYRARVEGNPVFDGFKHPVKNVVIKLGKPFDGPSEDHPLEQEIEMSKLATRGLVKLLDSGNAPAGFPGHKASTYPFAVYEKLSPMDRVPGLMNFATATDIITNLLFQLTYIHKSMVLLDIKPENIMLRMPPKKGDLTEEAYIRKIATGQYEPVFIDIGSAKTRETIGSEKTSGAIGSVGGIVKRLAASKIYLPPETRLTSKNELLNVSEANDIYALTLTFYELLSDKKPYDYRLLAHEKPYDKKALADRDGLIEEPAVSPVDLPFLERLAQNAPLIKENTRDEFVAGFMGLFKEGLSPAPKERSSAKLYLKRFFEVFRIKDRLPNTNGADYTYDSGKGMKWEQTIMRKSDPETALRATGRHTRPTDY